MWVAASQGQQYQQLPAFNIIINFPMNKAMFSQTLYPAIYSNTHQTLSAQYYLIEPALFHSLMMNIEQMKFKEQKLKKQVNELRQECGQLKTRFGQNLETLVRECLNQQLNTKQESENFSLCIKNHTCKIKGCQRRYSSKTALMAHLRSKHETSEYYD